MDITYYLTFDLPVPYRSIMLYPVTVKDFLLFNVYAQCLTIDKNSIPDAKIITMTYLEYLYYATSVEADKKPYLLWLDRLLAMCLKDDKSFEDVSKSIARYKVDEKSKPFFTIGNNTYTSKDFEEIKEIIAQQNSVELIDETISKEVRDSLEQAKEYKNKLAGNKSASFEDYLIAISVATGWQLDYIYTMSIRKFLKSVTRLDNLIHYKIYLAASMSGMVEFKDTSFIKHWLTNLDGENKYKDVSMEMETLQDKVSLESAKE